MMAIINYIFNDNRTKIVPIQQPQQQQQQQQNPELEKPISKIINNRVFGKYTYGNPEMCWTSPNVNLMVGNFCSIAKDVKVYLGNGCGHRTDYVTTYPFGHIHQNIFNVKGCGHTTQGNVIIGSDVWIGENVIIMSGVHIGDGVVIANNSHVVKNVEPYAIIGGNPAKTIKYRFTQEQIQQLLKIKWWEWDDSKINSNIQLIYNNNIDVFIEQHKI